MFDSDKKYHPIVAILLFCVIILVLGFYNSRKVILWESQDSEGVDSAFKQAIFGYANFAQSVKTELNIDQIFQQEIAIWKSFKESPLVFGQPQAVPEEEAANTQENPKEDVLADKPSDPGLIINAPPAEVATTTVGQPAVAGTSTISVAAPKKTAPVASASKKASAHRILIIGDSFMAVGGGLGDPLERVLLNFKDTVVVRQGKVSSGLSRQDYFDWPALTKKLIAQNNPNIAVMMFGSNDNNPVIDPNGKIIASYGSSKWDDQYRKRIDQMLDLFTAQKAEIFVVGVPIMKNPAFAKKIKHINSLYEEETAKYSNAHFISTWDLLADANGNYTQYLVDKDGKQRLIRTSDGVHLQYFAGYYVSDAIYKTIKQTLGLESK